MDTTILQLSGRAGRAAHLITNHGSRLTVKILAMVADEERRLISKRTKEALTAAQVRGAQLGGQSGQHHLSGDARSQPQGPSGYLRAPRRRNPRQPVWRAWAGLPGALTSAVFRQH